MDAAWGLLTIAGVTLAFNIIMRLFDGGFSLSGRMATLETNSKATRQELQNSTAAIQAELKKIGDLLVEMADVRGELKVIDARLTSGDERMQSFEKDLRELRHGDGFIRGTRGIDREYP